MSESLYVTFGEPVLSKNGGPGTIRTNAVETIDNDHAVDAISVLSDPGPNPGTRITETVETVDDDDAISLLSHLRASDPRPPPGTTLTATVETTDEDASSVLSQLR